LRIILLNKMKLIKVYLYFRLLYIFLCPNLERIRRNANKRQQVNNLMKKEKATFNPR